MFKDVLSDLAKSVVTSSKNTVKSYSPLAGLGEGSAFERIAHQGISNLAYRSPLMTDIAASMLESFQQDQLRQKDIRNYVKSDDSKELREQMRQKLGPDVSEKTLDKEMIAALRKLVTKIDDIGIKEAKTTESYKEFGKHIEKIFGLNTPEKQPSTTVSGTPQVLGDGSASDQLNKIEVNTHRTVNTLEEMAMKNDLAGRGSGISGAGATGGNSVAAYVDPLTGLPSAKVAAGAIGGKLLANIFDDEAITKIAKKTKQFLNLTDEEQIIQRNVSGAPPDTTPDAPRGTRVTPAERNKETLNKSIKDVLGDLDLDLNKHVVIKETNDTTGSSTVSAAVKPEVKTEEDVREEAAVESKREAEKTSIAKETLSEIKKLSGKGLEKPADGKGLSSVLDVVKNKVIGSVLSKIPGIGGLLGGILGGGAAGGIASKAGGSVLGGALSSAGRLAGYIPGALSTIGTAATGALGTLGGLASTAASGIGAAATAAAPALAVAGAGAAGYAAGKYIVNPLIDKGISAATGKSDMTLGSYIYDLLNSEENDKVSAMLKTQNVDVAKKTVAKELAAVSAKKEELSNSQPPQQTNITLNNTSGGASKSSQSNQIIAPVSVRNPDSTFERVQMQSFWSRSF